MSISSKIRQLGRVLIDPRWWPFYFQRQVMLPNRRNYLGNFVASRLRPEPVFGKKISNDPDQMRMVRQCVSQLGSAGISHFGQLLSREQTAELTNYFLGKKVKDPYRKGSKLFYPDSGDRHPESHIAHHDPVDIMGAPYLFSLANRADILAVVEGLLGCKPTLGYMAAWWSYATDIGAQQAEHFHRDVDDWRFIKLFVYLTDVGHENGPHIYVCNSSVSPELREIRRFTDDEVVASFGKENIMEIIGKAGEGFLEDTFGVHKGQPVASGRRLIFQAVYSMYPLPYGPKNPVASIEGCRLDAGHLPDLWTNRLYIK